MTYRVPYCWNEGELNSYCYNLEEDKLVSYCYYGCENNGCIDKNCDNDCQSSDQRCDGFYEQSCGRYDSDACTDWPASTSGEGNDDCRDCSCICGGYGLPEVDDTYCSDGKDNDCDGLVDDNDPGCGGIEIGIDWEKITGDSNNQQGNTVGKVYGG